jgi:hypothetical protein
MSLSCAKIGSYVKIISNERMKRRKILHTFKEQKIEISKKKKLCSTAMTVERNSSKKQN